MPSAQHVFRRVAEAAARQWFRGRRMPAVFTAAAALLLSGCGTFAEGTKVVEGNDLSIGISLPYTEGEMSFTVINWLSGFRFNAERNARAKLTFSCAETNSYLGVIHTCVRKEVTAEIEPTVDEEEPEPEGH